MFTDSAADVALAFEDVLPVDPPSAAKRREVCQPFQHGRCRRGAHCPERHVISQLRAVRLEACRHWLRGACVNGENCLYLHEYDDRYVPACAFYQRLGECTNPECPFKHVAREDNNNINNIIINNNNNNNNKPECAAFRRGFCPLGPKCRLRHVLRVACPFYMSGFCPLGPRCGDGHPVQQLYDRNSCFKRLQQRMVVERGGVNGDPTFKPNVTCHSCFDPGHIAPNCPGLQSGVLRRMLMELQEPGEEPYFQTDGRVGRKCCFSCGEEGHEVRDCPKKPRNR